MKNPFKNFGFRKMKKKAAQFISSFRFNGVENYFDTLNLGSFKDSLYLNIGVSMIRETVSSIPLEMYRIKNKQGEVEEVYENPILSLLQRPNDRQTQKEFWKLAVAYYLLSGEAFWYLERGDNTDEPTAMVNMRPDHVEILLSEGKKDIIGYSFHQSNGETLRIPKENVLHIKNIDPVNPLRGTGVIAPATQRIILEKEASRYQSLTFKSQGRPDIAVFLEQDLSDEEAEDARARWNKVYGSGDSSSAGFFGSQVKDLKLLSISPKEMGFMESMKFTRDDILGALRIPKAMITSDDVNLANSQTARINYVKEACLPVLDTFIDVINNMLLNSLGEDTFITYESPVNEDRELLLKEAKELKEAGIISVNEARALMNYPEVEGGDTIESNDVFRLSMRKIALRKIAKNVIRQRALLYRRLDATEKLAKAIAAAKAEKGVQRAKNPVFHTQEMRNAYVKAYHKNIDQRAEAFKDAVDVYNDGFYQRIVKHIEQFGLSADSFFDPSTELRTARNMFLPLMKGIYSKNGQDVLDGVANGFSSKASEQFYTAEQIIRQLELRADFFVTSMIDTDFKQLKKIITDGMAEGLGVDSIARLIRGYFDDMSVSRARTIARTETGRLISSSTNDAYNQSEIVTGKEWLTARDGKVRDVAGTINDHVHNEGKIVDTRDIFPNGERFPGELTINCRCALAPAV